MTLEDEIFNAVTVAIRMAPEGRWVEKEGVVETETSAGEQRIVTIVAVGQACEGLQRILREHAAIDPRSTLKETDE